MTDTDYADDPALLVNKPARAESRLHSLGQVAIGIDFYVNANKTKFMCFKQERAIFTFSSRPLKL